jgi:hypothetical protein
MFANRVSVGTSRHILIFWLWLLRLIVIIRLASVWILAVMLRGVLMIVIDNLLIALSSIIPRRDMLHLHLQTMHGSSELVA